ncbi:ABC transporter substrate-binding protein [Amycolatopsis orientalis]|uniref:ABC transporter substrate-binding protein n=1 Tax=Amycolatopsis orientalis TaxID=31958 RepID=UPI00039BF384|nr:ABC transporter substrate-binding protein [Amycolatopsis orientalis]
METLAISATAHGVNYLPEYLAREHGIFARNGLDVPYRPRNPWDGVMHDLADGSADLALGGLWVPAMYAGNGRDFVAVAQLNDRFPMAIVTREPVEGFTLAWLLGKTVLAPGQGGGAPGEFTRGLMREAGLAPYDARFVHDLSMQMFRELFVAGLGDAFVTDLGTATELERAGTGHIVFRHAESGGRMPNSVYYALRERLDELQPRLVPFVRSIDEAMRQLRTGAAGDLTPLFEKEWPEADPGVLSEVAAQIAANGTWAGVRLDPGPVERWTSILHTAGLTVSPVKFESIVDTRALDAAGETQA